MEELRSIGITGTFSISSQNKPWLWDLLSSGLIEGSWRAVTINGITASVLSSGGTRRSHQLITNLFVPNPQQIDLNIIPTDDITESEELDFEDSAPLYSIDYLTTKTVNDLRKICSEYNIRPGKRNKAKLVEHIFTVLQDPKRRATESETMIKELHQTIFLNDPIHHLFYRSHFNSIDIHDRMWYRFCYGYRVFNWRLVYTMNLLKVASINSWVIYNEYERLDQQNYLENVAIWCIKQ